MSEKRKDKKGRLLQPNERQRSNGQYEYRYKDGNGVRHSIYSWRLVRTDKVPAGKRDCEALRDAEARIANEDYSGLDTHVAETQTLNDGIVTLMETKMSLNRKSKDQYEYTYTTKIGPYIGRQKISKLKRNDIKKFYVRLLDDGNSIETVAKVDQTLKLIVKNAINNRGLRYDPCDGVLAELKREIKYIPKSKHCLTIEEQKAFLGYIAEHERYSHWYPLFKFMLGTGCRVGEALGLTWSDCDFDNNLIYIRRSMIYYKTDGTDNYGFSISTPKTASGVRSIPMLSSIRDLLLEEREKQTRYISKEIEIEGLTGFIWRTKKGSLPIPGTVNAALYAIQRDYNDEEMRRSETENRQPLLLPKFSAHVLRHTFCTRLCENETNLKVIQDVMGHASITTTMNVYNEATAGQKQKSFANLDGKIV